MSSRKHLIHKASFKASTSFCFAETLVNYRATVKLEPLGLINTWLDDFRVAYTILQAVQVATSLNYSLIHLAKQLGSIGEEEKLEHRIACWSDLIAPYLSRPQPGVDQMYYGGSGEDFVASGAFHDPDPIVEFDDDQKAIYDLSINLEDGSIMMRFGWVAWMLAPSEAEWLAEQMWTAAFLAAKRQGISK
ncbi:MULTISPECIES: hypothetical protein [Pseudomonas]|uniref:Uncharacterized protein n=1 Tax=Pseudomonas kurunegalensis TaxID=485880 RepID=A0ACC5UP01_9PSED|nr:MULTISPECIES: hypothetical protein [Pseudomonas]MBV4516177.1 hypothetical protein [Pseudomonas kurunegalensis]